MVDLNKDTVFQKKREIGDFKFDESIASVFDDMLNRSVPMYQEIQKQISFIIEYFLPKNTNIYDLGCSLGTTLYNIIDGNKKEINCIGYDNSQDMIAIAESRRHKYYKALPNIRFEQKDITLPLKYNNAGAIILCLTLQFIDQEKRLPILKNIFEQLRNGGIIIIVEKIISEDNIVNDVYKDIYYQRKFNNGYSKREIAEKEKSLKGFMMPFTHKQNEELLKSVGFDVFPFFNWFNFVGFLGIKNIKG